MVLRKQVISIKFQETLGIRFFFWNSGNSIENLCPIFSLLFHCSLYFANIRHSFPYTLELYSQLHRCPYFTQLISPMPFLPLLKILPFALIILCILKKIPSYFIKPSMIF
jgi:hypothetical protein